MVDINHRERTIKVKLVYYGPAVGGKTTNLQVLFEHALGPRRGQLVSVNSAQDRTILCDLLPLRSGGFRGYDLKLQLVAVPGQAMYAATRRVVLKGADAVVFVANSAADRWHENLQSLQEMTANLLAQQIDPRRIPLVFQYNKRDLPEVSEIADLSHALNDRRAPEFPAVAPRGEGVLETFSAILTLAIEDLCRCFASLQLPGGQTVEAWTRQAIQGMFGSTRLGLPAETEEAETLEPGELGLEEEEPASVEPPGPLRLRIPTPQDAPRAGATAGETRSAGSLTESYAEASAELGLAVSDLREERDLARVRLREVRRALELATEAPGVTDIEARVRAILQVFMQAAGASGATLLLSSGEAAQVLALPPLVADPLSRTTWGAAHLEGLADLAEPRLEEADASPDLAETLRAGEPSFEAVALVPLRSAERLLGLALLYFGPYAVLPTPDGLVHLGFLARVLTGPLEASAAREVASTADRLKMLSRASAAAVASLLTRLPQELARRQRLRLTDVLGPLRVSGVSVQVASPGVSVVGDAPLLRFALATLVRQCEADALERGRTPEVSVRAALEHDAVHVHITGGGRASMMSAPETGPDLADAELSVVHAIVALHGGLLVSSRGEGQAPQFTVKLISA
jgi:signal recognition particle receptor subunit beta